MGESSSFREKLNSLRVRRAATPLTRQRKTMLRAIIVTAALAGAVTPYPKGAYKGQDKFLGQKIGAELTVKNSTHLDINLFGALGISCQDEPYTFADNEIKLTSTDPNDCLVKKLKKDNAEVTSAPFDPAKNAVTLNVAVQLPGASNGQKIPFSLELDSEATKVKAM